MWIWFTRCVRSQTEVNWKMALMDLWSCNTVMRVIYVFEHSDVKLCISDEWNQCKKISQIIYWPNLHKLTTIITILCFISQLKLHKHTKFISKIAQSIKSSSNHFQIYSILLFAQKSLNLQLKLIQINLNVCANRYGFVCFAVHPKQYSVLHWNLNPFSELWASVHVFYLKQYKMEKVILGDGIDTKVSVGRTI